MIEQPITIFKNLWEKHADGLWYVHVPTLFDCDDTTETIMELADPEDYVKEHKEVFDSLNNGYTGKNEVVISCKIQPTCDIKVIVKTLEQAGGRIVYDKDGNPEYIPDNNFDVFSALGGMMGGAMPPEMTNAINNSIVDAEGKVISSEDIQTDSK